LSRKNPLNVAWSPEPVCSVTSKSRSKEPGGTAGLLQQSSFWETPHVEPAPTALAPQLGGVELTGASVDASGVDDGFTVDPLQARNIVASVILDARRPFKVFTVR
jgi:hypothetical protein